MQVVYQGCSSCRVRLSAASVDVTEANQADVRVHIGGSSCWPLQIGYTTQ